MPFSPLLLFQKFFYIPTQKLPINTFRYRENISNEKTRKAPEKEKDHFHSAVENRQLFGN